MIVNYGCILGNHAASLFLLQGKYTLCVWLENREMCWESEGMLLGRFGNWDTSPVHTSNYPEGRQTHILKYKDISFIVISILTMLNR